MVETPGGGLYLDGLNVGEAGHSLAVLGDVSRLVNEFAGGVFLARANWHAGKAKNPIEMIEKDAARCGAIVLGKDPSWAAQPWNSPERLGTTLKGLLPDLTAHYGGDSGKALFVWLGGQLVEISQEVEEGRMTEEGAKPHIARLCVDVAGRLMGTGNMP